MIDFFKTWYTRRKLRKAIEKQPFATRFHIRILAKTAPSTDVRILATAIQMLVKEGVIIMRYAVVRSDGKVSVSDFTDPRDIPPVITEPDGAFTAQDVEPVFYRKK